MEATSRSGKSATEFDVYLSFRGPDTRNNFTDFLYQAMVDQEIGAYRDREILHAGDDQVDELLTVAGDSKIFIPVLSKGYAASACCLRELAHAVELKESAGRPVILPIFYDVAPYEVKSSWGPYERDLQKHESKHGGEITQQWEAALRKVGSIWGWEVQGKPQGELVMSIVREISSMLKIKHSYMPEDLKHSEDPEDISTGDHFDLSSIVTSVLFFAPILALLEYSVS